MRGLRLNTLALVCLIGMMGGCAHHVRIGTDDGTVTGRQNRGKPLYLKTYCVPVFTGAVAIPWLGATLASLDSSYSETRVLIAVGLLATAGAAVFDHLRCGAFPPKLTTVAPNALPEPYRNETTSKK